MGRVVNLFLIVVAVVVVFVAVVVVVVILNEFQKWIMFQISSLKFDSWWFNTFLEIFARNKDIKFQQQFLLYSFLVRDKETFFNDFGDIFIY